MYSWYVVMGWDEATMGWQSTLPSYTTRCCVMGGGGLACPQISDIHVSWLLGSSCPVTLTQCTSGALSKGYLPPSPRVRHDSLYLRRGCAIVAVCHTIGADVTSPVCACVWLGRCGRYCL